jgi:hypothetical protein
MAALQTIAGSHVASLRAKSSNLMFRGLRCRVLVPAPCSATTQSSPKSVDVLHFPDLEATAKPTGKSVQSWTVDVAHNSQLTAHCTLHDPALPLFFTSETQIAALLLGVSAK